MARRSLLLVLALLIALCGTGAVALYVSKADARAQAGEAQQAVLVAQKLIKSGTSIEDARKNGAFASVSMPKRNVPANAVIAASDVAGQTAVADIYPGLPLVRSMFAMTAAATGNLTIPDGKLAMAVQLTDPERVAGFVVPGSEVAIYATLKVKQIKANGQTGDEEDVTQLILPRVSVLAVGEESLRHQSSDKSKSSGGLGTSSDGTVSVAVLTVAVDQVEGEHLAHAAQTGELYFALLSTSSKTGNTLRPVDAGSLLGVRSPFNQ